MITYFNYQASDLRDRDHVALVTAPQGKVNVLAPNTYSSSSGGLFHSSRYFPSSSHGIEGQRLFDHFADLAHERGYKVLIWWPLNVDRFRATSLYQPNWDVFNLPVATKHKKHILNFTIPQVRDVITNEILHWLDSTPADGVSLDYIRGDWRTFEAVPGFTDAVTTTVKQVREATRSQFPNALLCAHTFTRVMDAALPMNENFCQNWPYWLDADLVDFVFPMSYSAPERLPHRLENMGSGDVKQERVYPKITPGPLPAKGIADAMSHDEFAQCIQTIKAAGFPGCAYWDYLKFLPQHYAAMPAVQPLVWPPPPPPPEPTPAEIIKAIAGDVETIAADLWNLANQLGTGGVTPPLPEENLETA